MKFLRRIVFLLLFLIICLVVISFFLPKQVDIERSLVVNAPQSTVFNQVNNLKNWEQWSPWKQMDPTMEITYEGNPSGVGAQYNWVGEKSGNGYLQIKESVPNKSIKTYLNFGSQGDGNSTWTFEPQGNQTKATWQFSTDLGYSPISRWRGLFIDRFLGSSFQDGLENIQKVIEGK